MKKIAESVFVCANCGNEFTKWSGQCGACGEWNSLKEVTGQLSLVTSKKGKRVEKVESINLGKINESMGSGSPIRSGMTDLISTTIGEFDRVLGKGIVRGSVVLFAGEPGIGKSTLLTQLVGKIGGLYVAGEESAGQIRMRVERLGLRKEVFEVLETNDVDSITEYLNRVKNVFNVVVVDSIQVLSTQEIAAGAGSPSQIRECAFRLIAAAKKLGVAIFLVGHVTKEGEIAGPKLLEHMVDTVLYFEGERNGDLRILRSVKNRFGPTDEVGVFRMDEKGLNEVRNQDINLVEGENNKIGSAVTILLEGTRPMMVEIEALVTESFAPMPKRIFSGVDYNRGQLLVAVAQKVLGIPLYKYDVFIAVSGGLKITETGADLAMVAAIWSSYKEKPLATGHWSPAKPLSPPRRGPSPLEKGSFINPVFVGEVSLLGEVKKVRGMEKREKEAEAMGRKMVVMKNVAELK